MLTPWKESYDQPRQHIKKQRYYSTNKGPSSQGYGFSSGHVWMWELDSKESWVLNNWCFWTVVLETLESPLDWKEVQSVNPRDNQSWTVIGSTDAEAETAILWPPHVKSWLIGKDLDAGRDWGQEEKGMTDDEMAGWHHGLDGQESEWTLGVGVGGLVCWDSWSRRVGHDWVTELNWTLGFSSFPFVQNAFSTLSLSLCIFRSETSLLQTQQACGSCFCFHLVSLSFDWEL